MKKILFGFLIALFIVSCALPTTSFQKPKQNGVDFSTGKWLLYTLDASNDVSKKLEQKITKDFSEILKNRFTYYPNSNGLLIAQKTGMQLDKKTIKSIKDGTNYDYFITIKAGKISEDLGSISFEQITNAEESNSGYVEMEIYDLNSETVMYSQKATSSVRRPNDDKTYLSKSSTELIHHAYTKLFNDLKTKSKR